LNSGSLWSQQFVADKLEFRTYRPNDAFSIDVPDYLVKVNDLDSRASLQFKNIFNETYLMVVAGKKSLENHLSLEQLQNHFEQNLLMNGGWLVKRKEMKIGNSNAFQNEVQWIVDGESLVYLITFVDSPDTLYKIYSWTLASQSEYLAHFTLAANSFVLHKQLTSKR
jgi:hypothetical protein